MYIHVTHSIITLCNRLLRQCTQIQYIHTKKNYVHVYPPLLAHCSRSPLPPKLYHMQEHHSILPFQRVLIISIREIQKVLSYRVVSGEMYACLELAPPSVEIRVNPQRRSSGSLCATAFPFSPCTPPRTTVGKFTGHLHPSR